VTVRTHRLRTRVRGPHQKTNANVPENERTPKFPNSRDADFLAWVMLSASRAHLARGILDLVIAADESGCLDYLKHLVAGEPVSLCHYESFPVAKLD